MQGVTSTSPCECNRADQVESSLCAPIASGRELATQILFGQGFFRVNGGSIIDWYKATLKNRLFLCEKHAEDSYRNHQANGTAGPWLVSHA
jgi:hypothetical protein